MDILDDKKNKYKVCWFDYEEKVIELKRDTEKKSCYPEGETLNTKPNLSNINQQRRAINNLQYIWNEHKPLMKLFDKKNDVFWLSVKNENNKDIYEWKILDDDNFKGVDKQREFVEKALATSDFAFLDGPPGTGKTTAILELIYQIVKQNKKVLLCASTHAAINNVLEKIDEKKLDNEIFALRIGDIDRASGVEKYTLDYLLKEKKLDEIYKQLYIESSNLVCGTTMGMSNFFKLLGKNSKSDNNTPIFDYLIIDESSKTTVQEFLVPAMLAKKCILSGDIKQLSPFTDRSEVEGSLKELFNKNQQRAIFILQYTLNEIFYNKRSINKRFILVEEDNVIDRLIKELDARFKYKDYKHEKETYIVVYYKEECHIFDMLNKEKYVTKDLSYLLGADILFLNKNDYNKLQFHLPFATNISLYKNDEPDNFSFLQNYRIDNNQKEEKEKYTKELREKDWSGELIWRLERLHWLRYSKCDNIKKQVGELIPRYNEKNEDDTIYNKVNRIKEIAFKSILEALTKEPIEKQQDDIATVLNSGLPKDKIEEIQSTLTYQHRMHKDISAFPREHIYGNKSLQDGNVLDGQKEWSYTKYKTHSIWLDVDVNGKTEKGSNKEEVKVIKKELETFLEWSSKNNNEGKNWEIAILTPYKKQEKELREMLQKFTNTKRTSHFYLDNKNAKIKLATIDFIQGQEADIVFLSMVNTDRDGFMDSPNRLNVAITRARYQLVIVGKWDYYSSRSKSTELKNLAQYHKYKKEKINNVV